jgi:hypothetical protein
VGARVRWGERDSGSGGKSYSIRWESFERFKSDLELMGSCERGGLRGFRRGFGRKSEGED